MEKKDLDVSLQHRVHDQVPEFDGHFKLPVLRIHQDHNHQPQRRPDDLNTMPATHTHA